MDELSFGQKAVGLIFNPSAGSEVGDHVQSIKSLAADFIDTCNNLRNRSEDSEVKRMLSVAITEAQTAQMWAVKAVTWIKEEPEAVDTGAEAPEEEDEAY